MTSKCAIILLIVVALNASICCNAIKRKQDPVPVAANFILESGHDLNSGKSLQNNNYVLTMQQDCNLVLYDSGKLIWSTNTGGIASDCICSMQYDGSLVVWSKEASTLLPLWTSNSSGSRSGANYVLILQKDRNLVIYGPAIWATATNA